MFDYQTSKHAHFDAACRAFAIEHNLEDVAAAVGMRPQILRNKLNPAQPHRLTCDELLAITDYTEDARLLDGMLGQINCLPSVPVNNATEGNMQAVRTECHSLCGSNCWGSRIFWSYDRRPPYTNPGSRSRCNP